MWRGQQEGGRTIRPGAMLRGGRIAATLAVAMLGTAGVADAAPRPASAAHARSQLVWTRQVSRDVTRYQYRYGPLVAAPGQNLVLVTPLTIERPPGDGYMTRMKPELVDADGVAPPVEQVHMHHAVVVNLSRTDRTAPAFPERIGGFAEEKTIAHLPAPYGYPVKATDVWGVNYMLHNETPDTRAVWIQYDVDWVAADSGLAKQMKPAHPYWLDVENGKAYPVFDVPQGAGAKGRFAYPDQAVPDPYGGGERRNEWTADRDLTLVAAAGHLHPGGLWTDLDVVRGGRRVRAFRSEARYFDPNGPVSWDLAMTFTPDDWRVSVRKGDVLRVSTTYETRRASWYESMGIVLAFAADGATGTDPFERPVTTAGEPTHGHLPEAGNHGGAATGLPDARQLADGATVANGVAITDFVYMPGDLTGSGVFGSPPVVQPGDQLRFGNFDSSADIYHTITACRAPCNASTGISYPLANGRVRFDSGQLGYGPEGYTAAAQRSDWYTPPDLAPGTYTYFCRTHPFMRGAFRVAGTPAPEPPEPSYVSSLAIGPKRVRVDRSGRARLRLRCGDGDGCAGRLELTSASRGRTRMLAASRYSLEGGTARTIVLRLGRKARAELARRGRLRATAIARGEAGSVARSLVLERRR
jgi:plastocyanin